MANKDSFIHSFKMDRYNFEPYRFKVGPFFETRCRKVT